MCTLYPVGTETTDSKAGLFLIALEVQIVEQETEKRVAQKKKLKNLRMFRDSHRIFATDRSSY